MKVPTSGGGSGWRGRRPQANEADAYPEPEDPGCDSPEANAAGAAENSGGEDAAQAAVTPPGEGEWSFESALQQRLEAISEEADALEAQGYDASELDAAASMLLEANVGMREARAKAAAQAKGRGFKRPGAEGSYRRRWNGR